MRLLLIDIGRLTIGYRSDMEGTAIRWNGRKHRWRLGMMERSELASRLLPAAERLLDRHVIAKPNDWGTSDRDVQVAAGSVAIWWDRWRVPDPVKAAERKKEGLARLLGGWPVYSAQELEPAA